MTTTLSPRARAPYAPGAATFLAPVSTGEPARERAPVDGEPLASGSVGTWAGVVSVTASERGVRAIRLPRWGDVDEPPARGDYAAGAPFPVKVITRADSTAAADILSESLCELEEYFAGVRRGFLVPPDPIGTPFYRAAWDEVARVPYGETRSYGEIAAALGTPRATRAVGLANGRNPLAPLIPCHRIVGSDGRLTGYGPGLPLKQRLLVMEDALPAHSGAYDHWITRLTDRLGTEPLLGIRATGHYCTPQCTHARANLRPARVFRAREEAEAAGFTACPRCTGAVAESAGLW